MDLGLRGKTVLITGASGGIGRALALAFAEEGARLVLHAHRNRDPLADWLRGQPLLAGAEVVTADVACAAAVDGMFAAACAAGRIDVCVANAGIWPAEPRRLHTMPEARIRQVLEVNLLGCILTARAFLRALATGGPRPDGDGAVLLFVGSTAGRFGERDHAEYAAAKSGLVGLMLSLKNEIADLDPLARVNLIEPGWTVTEMTRGELADDTLVRRTTATMALRRIATPRDVARVAVALASPAMSRHVTGQTVTVAGGMEGRQLWSDRELDAAAIRARSADAP